MKLNSVAVLVMWLMAAGVAAEDLVLELDLDTDLLSMVHNVDGFLFNPTVNTAMTGGDNLSDRMLVTALQNHLVATAVVRIDGEIAGVLAVKQTEDPKGVFDVVKRSTTMSTRRI